MSEWVAADLEIRNEIDDDGIDFDPVEKEVYLFVKQDNFGSVYAVLTFAQVQRLWEDINEPPPAQSPPGR